MNNQLLALLLRQRGLLDDPATVIDDQPKDNELAARLLANWNPLIRQPVYQPTTISGGVRG